MPPVDIARLVAAGNEQNLSVADDIYDVGIVGGIATWNDQRCNRIHPAKRIDKRVVIIATGRAQDEKIPSRRFFTQELEGFVQVRASSH